MTNHADLEIGFYRRAVDQYVLEMRFNSHETDTDTRLLHEEVTLSLNQEALNALSDQETYGRELTRLLFSRSVLSAFTRARTTAAQAHMPLRVRLFFGPGAPELHGVRWETLRDPESNGLLFTNERILLSRYLTSAD
ncbi:MAG: hypothetical protein QNK37_32340 [Acidobacteriota bacterium]|nr:hypothetical protein [Acidobacteriota bacterium]